jgi:casein kinase 1
MNGNHNVMLLDLLGRNLEELLQEQGKTLSLKTVVMLGLQILDRIEYLHSSHFLHRDIKPENFLMGTGDDAHRLYMIDLGLAKKYIREGTKRINLGKHNPYRDGQDLLGTICYVSVNTHLGI